MAGLCDRAASSYEPDVAVLMSAQPSQPPDEAAQIEHAYREHRGRCSRCFEPTLGASLMRRTSTKRRGPTCSNCAGVARSRGTLAPSSKQSRGGGPAGARKMRPDPLDPTSAAFDLIADSEAGPDEQATIRLEAAALREVIDDLEPRYAAVLKLRFDWQLDSREIQHCLGVSPKRLEKIVTEAYGHSPTAGDEGRPHGAGASGVSCSLARPALHRNASAGAHAHGRARPGGRAMLREMRAGLSDLAAAAPLPVLIQFDESHAQHGVGLFDGLRELLAQPRRLSMELLVRAPDAPSIAERLSLGRPFGSGAAAQFVAFCLAAGGTVTACSRASPASPEPRSCAASSCRGQASDLGPKVAVPIRLPHGRRPRAVAYRVDPASRHAHRQRALLGPGLQHRRPQLDLRNTVPGL